MRPPTSQRDCRFDGGQHRESSHHGLSGWSVANSVSTATGTTKTLGRRERGCRAPGLGEGLTALVVEVVHGTLGRVIKGAGLVHGGAGPREQQGGSEVQGGGQRQRPGVRGGPAALSLLQAAEEGPARGSAPLRATGPRHPSDRPAGAHLGGEPMTEAGGVGLLPALWRLRMA